MFDRVLTRFYHKWLVNREWSVKNFYFEFDEEEYAIDVLKYGAPSYYFNPKSSKRKLQIGLAGR